MGAFNFIPNDLEKKDEDYEDIVDENLPLLEFEEIKLSEITLSNLTILKEITKEFGLTDYQIAGGFAVAVGNFESWNFEANAWHNEVSIKYGDIDIYVEPSDFARLVKSGKYEDVKPNLITHTIMHYYKTKMQIICKQKYSIERIVSSFDLNITGFYIDVKYNQKPCLFKDKELQNFDQLIVKRVNKFSKQHTFDRIEKYIKRYSCIGSVIFEKPELFVTALQKYNGNILPLKKENLKNESFEREDFDSFCH